MAVGTASPPAARSRRNCRPRAPASPTGRGRRDCGTPPPPHPPPRRPRSTTGGGWARLRHTAYIGGLILTETGLALSTSHRTLTPYLDEPGGSVLVHSDFADGSSSVLPIQFGGLSAVNTSRSGSQQLTNQLSWFSGNNHHRLKLTSELRHDDWSLEQAGNLLGSFVFNQLADLAAGTPAQFSRQFAPVSASGGQIVGSVALGDAWRPNTDLQIVYGVRLDANHYLDRPPSHPAVLAALGVANAAVPHAVVRAGIGVFQNTPGAQLIAQAMTNTGLANGVQQLTCIGPAAPTPDWAGYAADPSTIPTSCANGAPPSFGNAQPNVSLFAPDYAAQRSLRSTLQWAGPVIDKRFMATVTGTWSRNHNQSGTLDLNFAPTVRFTLQGEAGRPVFVQPAEIAGPAH